MAFDFDGDFLLVGVFLHQSTGILKGQQDAVPPVGLLVNLCVPFDDETG